MLYRNNTLPELSLKPTIIDMTTPSPQKVIPVDEIRPQNLVTPPLPQHECKKEEKIRITSSTTKSEDTHKRRKRAKRKHRNEKQVSSTEEDQELLLTQQPPSGDEEELVATLLPLQRSHDQSCDQAMSGNSHPQSVDEGTSQTNHTSRELLLNLDDHSAAEEGGAVSLQASKPQDSGQLTVH